MESIPVKHHPDIRWVAAASAVITALVAGGIIYWNSAIEVRNELAAARAENDETVEGLRAEIGGLRLIVEGMKQELTAKNAGLTAPAGPVTSQALFTSRHGFSLRYPQSWIVVDTASEDYATLAEAQKTLGNHLAFLSFVPSSAPVEGVPAHQAKLELWVYSTPPQKGLDEWIGANHAAKDILSVADIQVGPFAGKMVEAAAEPEGEKIRVIYFQAQSLWVQANVYPENTQRLEEAKAILSAFVPEADNL